MNGAQPAPTIKLDIGNAEPTFPIHQSQSPQAPAQPQTHGMPSFSSAPTPFPVPSPAPAPAHAPVNGPTSGPSPASPRSLPQASRAHKPHPLLWVTLAISLLALVLGVPKGSLPTITGRHKALRAQEVLVQERLVLLNHLSTFLPPPLSALLAPELNDVRSTLDLVRLGTGLQLWNVNGQNDGVWWTLEELGSDATVVRSASNGNTREVWVLRDGADKGASGAIAALTASLAAREKLQRELDAYRSAPEVTISAEASREADVEERERAVEARERELELEAMRKSDRAAWEREVIVRDAAREARAADEAERERRKAAEKEERGREADAARRIRERLDEMEEREREVGRRELWIMDAMRKLSDKARENANELTMEDRITERLKVYQRQLAELHLSTE